MRKKLQQFRLNLGLSQDEMAKKTRCSKDHYIHVENDYLFGNEDFWVALWEVFKIPNEDMWSYIFDETSINEKPISKDEINKATGKQYTYKGVTGNLNYLCKKFNMKPSTVKMRMKRGFTLEEAIEKPLEKLKTKK